MATYGQLLIDAGGGIVDRRKQSERQEGASVIIGLGGTGSDAVMQLKREVYRQLKPDNTDAVLPKYESIKYLVVDADDSQIVQSGSITDIDKSTEFFQMVLLKAHLRQKKYCRTGQNFTGLIMNIFL